jgi:hypothetical protein
MHRTDPVRLVWFIPIRAARKADDSRFWFHLRRSAHLGTLPDTAFAAYLLPASIHISVHVSIQIHQRA